MDEEEAIEKLGRLLDIQAAFDAVQAHDNSEDLFKFYTWLVDEVDDDSVVLEEGLTPKGVMKQIFARKIYVPERYNDPDSYSDESRELLRAYGWLPAECERCYEPAPAAERCDLCSEDGDVRHKDCCADHSQEDEDGD